ncbi:MAG: SH3 domain-containing protein [Phyllobacteriaceae bacterium]|nr:SH3 domain-containing protein [Phyllobacteriaceae bacterium]
MPRLSPALSLASLLCLAVASAGTSYGVATWSKSAPKINAQAGEITASLGPAEPVKNSANDGGTGLPIPRFVTLKADKVNVRRGPSSDHPVAFVFQRKGLPVEITAEFENWRKIRDSDGAEGWILQSMLSGRRNGFVARWSDNKILDLRVEPSPNSSVEARLQPGVLASIESCDGLWCEISTGGYDGYVEQSQLWGVYPGEVVD